MKTPHQSEYEWKLKKCQVLQTGKDETFVEEHKYSKRGMFMNYQRIYNELIQRAHTRDVPSLYYETHHIIPRCVVEDNEPTNLVNLTAREHFIAHWLLIKIYRSTPHFYKMLYAFCMMKTDNDKQQRYHFSSRLYERYKQQWRHTEEAKEKLSKAHRGKKLSEETKRKISETRRRRYAEGSIQKLCGEDNHSFGKIHSEETRKKMSEKRLGRKDSEETKQKKRERMLKDNPMKGKTHTEEVRQKISNRFKGGKQSEDHIQKRTKHVQGSKHMYLPETGERYLVHQENIEEMLSRGYLFGMKPPKPPKQKKERMIEEKRWLFNPQTKDRVLVKVKDVDRYIEMGYRFGMK